MAKSNEVTGIAKKAALAAEELLSHRRQIQQARVREALTRTELSAALNEALAGRAEALRRAERAAAQRYLDRTPTKPLRVRHRWVRRLEKLLGRLGPVGQAIVIFRAGVWRGRSQPLRALRSILGYATRGSKPENQPDALFDQAWYLATYPEAATAGMTPLAHYLLLGAFVGHAPHPLFDSDAYVAQHARVLADHAISPLEHFTHARSQTEARVHPLFDLRHYLAQEPHLAPDEDALAHYLRQGWRDGLSPHPLFDAGWYLAQGPNDPDTDPLTHYMTHGWREGRTPHPLFDSRWYLENNPDLAAQDVEPLSHFLNTGAAEGRNPGLWFDLAHYCALRGGMLEPGLNPLIDYLKGGAWEVADTRPGFPTAAYLADQPASARGGMTPLEHWARQNAGRP